MSGVAGIWANRLIAGDKSWEEVPDNRKDEVRGILADRAKLGELAAERYKEITGEEISA